MRVCSHAVSSERGQRTEKTTQKSAENWIYQLCCTENLITMSLESHVITLCQHEMKILLASRQFNQLRLEWEGGRFCPPPPPIWRELYPGETHPGMCVCLHKNVCVCVCCTKTTNSSFPLAHTSVLCRST